MEHGLILLIEAILAIDRNLQKPVRAVVPNLTRLRAEPKAVLADGEIVFGPRRPHAVALVLGTIIGGIVLTGFCIAALDRPRNQPIEAWYYVAAGVSILICIAAATALLRRWLRGGSAVLQPQGVEFVYRGRSVFCPWALFQAAGSPYQPDHRRVILPVNDGTPVAVTDADGNVTASPAAEVKTRPLVGTADGQVTLHDLYEVKLIEFGELLLHLGRQLGDGRPVLMNGDAADGYAQPLRRRTLATVRPDGWLRVRLTGLPFPPVCLGCGTITREAISHTLDQRNRVQIDLPLCRACQVERTGRRRRAVLLGVAVGLTPCILGLLLASPFLAVEDLVVLGLILFLPGLLLGMIGGLIARDRAEPARFKEYAAAAGTVAIWLRPSAGATAMRRALGLDETAEPRKVGSAVAADWR